MIRPRVLSIQEQHIPRTLCALPQWLVWRLVETVNKETGVTKWDKPPVNARTGLPGSSTNSNTWSTFAEALAALSRGEFDGVGFALFVEQGTDADVIVAIDLDHCREPETVVIAPWAQKIIDRINSYTEVSPSGTGIRIFVRGRLPKHGRKKGPFECYCTARYVTVTGHHVPNTPTTIESRPEQLLAVHSDVFGDGKSKKRPVANTNGTATRINRDDEDIIRLGSRAANGAKFRCLMDGDCTGYPSASEADAALCSILFFWCQGDRAQVDRIFRSSKLFRDKWDERHGEQTYGEMTLDFAEEKCTEHYQPAAPPCKLALAKAAAQGAVHAPESMLRPSSASAPLAEQPRFAKDIILQYFRDDLRPIFRRGDAVYSESRGRDVKRSELTFGADSTLVALLSQAADCPKVDVDQGNGNVERRPRVAGIPKLFQTWSRTAWADLIASLPDEDASTEIAEPAQEEFRAQVKAALHRIVSLGRTYQNGNHEDVRVEHRSLIDWVALFAKPGRWSKIRSYCIWTRRETGASIPQIAVKVELFSGQGGSAVLAKLTTRKFAKMAELYGVGTASRAGGPRCVELAADFISELMDQPELTETTESPDNADTRENGSVASTSEEPDAA